MERHCALVCLLVCAIVSLSPTSAKNKRELPINYNCDPRFGTCFKGDLVSENVADCERDAGFLNFFTCDPMNDYFLSSVVDVPDVSKHNVDCVAKSGLPITCGTADTRCVCDKAVDYKRPQETVLNQCRCQYWPAVDARANQPSYCTQYDHGGTSDIHFYTCCNNCNDADSSCNGRAYQGGGTIGDDYCSTCGQNSVQGGGRITYRFNCVSCSQQGMCESICSSKVLRLTRYTPGLCPAWAGCFRGCCLKATNSRHKREANETLEVSEFCGDFVCQSGEDHTSCPTDCCPEYNPDECSPDTCNPDCCFEPHCCIAESASTGDAASSKSQYTAFSLLIAGALGTSILCF